MLVIPLLYIYHRLIITWPPYFMIFLFLNSFCNEQPMCFTCPEWKPLLFLITTDLFMFQYDFAYTCTLSFDKFYYLALHRKFTMLLETLTTNKKSQQGYTNTHVVPHSIQYIHSFNTISNLEQMVVVVGGKQHIKCLIVI